MPPRVRWWLLPVPFLLAGCLAVMLRVGEPYHEFSVLWRILAPHPRIAAPKASSDYLVCFVSIGGEVEVIPEEGSWDALDRALARLDGDVWVVSAERKRRWPSLMVPSFEVRDDKFLIHLLSPSYGPGGPPAKHGTEADYLAMKSTLRTWVLESTESTAKMIRSRVHRDSITSGTSTSRQPLWNHILLNAASLACLLLLWPSVTSWRSLFQRATFSRRSRVGMCVQCAYALNLTTGSAFKTCPECGTLNPPRPNPPPPQPSSPNSPPAPSSSPTPSEQSAPPPPEPPATTQSPPR